MVDDDEDTRTLLKTVLEKCGAQVRTVSAAREAVAALKEWRFDVLISDIWMPKEDGSALIEQVRALPTGEGGRTPAGR